MDPHRSKPDFATRSVGDLYDRLENILRRHRPDRLAAFHEYLHEQQEREAERPTARRRER